MKTPRKRRDGARAAVPPYVELRPTGDPPPDGQSALDLGQADPPSVGIVRDAEPITRGARSGAWPTSGPSPSRASTAMD